MSTIVVQVTLRLIWLRNLSSHSTLLMGQNFSCTFTDNMIGLWMTLLQVSRWWLWPSMTRSLVIVMTDCPYLVVLALLSCDQNARLYVHLRACCSASVLFTLFESLCQRPPSDIGIGIPLLNTLNNLTPMLSDIGTLLANQWPQMTVLHDIQLGSRSLLTSVLD